MRIDARKIERARLLRGWFRSDVAREAGVSLSAVNRAVQARQCGLHVLRSVCRALDLPVGDVIEPEPDVVER